MGHKSWGNGSGGIKLRYEACKLGTMQVKNILGYKTCKLGNRERGSSREYPSHET